MKQYIPEEHKDLYSLIDELYSQGKMLEIHEMSIVAFKAGEKEKSDFIDDYLQRAEENLQQQIEDMQDYYSGLVQ